MIRSLILPAVLLATLALACGNTSDEQKKRNADAEVAGAQARFMELREDYRYVTTMNLDDLDHEVIDLEAKATYSSGKARTELDANLKQIYNDRGVFEDDYKSLESATPSTWDDAKAQLVKEWTLLKNLVDRA